MDREAWRAKVSTVQLRKWGLECQRKCSELQRNQGQNSTSNPNTWGFLHGASSLSAYTRSVSCHTLSCYFFPWTSEFSSDKLKPHLAIILEQFGIFTRINFAIQEEFSINFNICMHLFQILVFLKMQGINQEDQSRSQSKRTWISPPLTNTSKAYLCVERFSHN